MSTVDALDSVGRVADIAVGLLLAAAHAVDTDLGLNDVHKVVEASAGGANRSLNIVLSAAVVLKERERVRKRIWLCNSIFDCGLCKLPFSFLKGSKMSTYVSQGFKL